jgi:TldD protein
VRVFAENALWLRRRFSADGRVDGESSVSRGVCIDTDLPGGVTEHRIAEGHADDTVTEVLASPLFELSEDEFVLTAKRTQAEITVGVRHQHVAAGTPDAMRTAERLTTSTEVRVYEPDGTSHAQVLLGGHGDILDILDVDQAAENVRARLALPKADSLPAQADLVLLPGLAGSFFHEVVGHPMEADVVASGTSYLGSRAAQQVAPEWLSVVDGAQRAEAGYRSAIDDEGTTCRDVFLIDRGRVGEPMTDLAIAQRLGRASSGHARRQSYRHPAIPRMTHTCALVGDDTEIAGPIPGPIAGPEGDWIAAYGLKLQMMSVTSGDFAFRASFAVLHRADGTVSRLGPFDVTGNGLQALGAMQSHSRTVAEYGRATGGCGKLGQFPVLVSFANAGVRLPAGSVTLREARRG